LFCAKDLEIKGRTNICLLTLHSIDPLSCQEELLRILSSEKPIPNKLFTQLRDSEDTLPEAICAQYGLPRLSTYSQLLRAISYGIRAREEQEAVERRRRRREGINGQARTNPIPERRKGRSINNG
jgi:hypothetical protein